MRIGRTDRLQARVRVLEAENEQQREALRTVERALAIVRAALAQAGETRT